MRITREIIEPRHRWRAIDNKRMAKVCKDVRKIISDFLGPQITLTQTSIRDYIPRECNQCSEFVCNEERGKCTRCPSEICAHCYELPGTNSRAAPLGQTDWTMVCRPCHKESCSLERNAWDLIKSFMIQKCHKCTKMITADSWKCAVCSKWHCDGCQMRTRVYNPSVWGDTYLECWECGYERAIKQDNIITDTWG